MLWLWLGLLISKAVSSTIRLGRLRRSALWLSGIRVPLILLLLVRRRGISFGLLVARWWSTIVRLRLLHLPWRWWLHALLLLELRALWHLPGRADLLLLDVDLGALLLSLLDDLHVGFTFLIRLCLAINDILKG